jgi:hypothetical protein
MRRAAIFVGLSCASIALTMLCGCSLERIFPSSSATLANNEVMDRALQLSSLTQSDQPFHLVLEVTPPPRAKGMILNTAPNSPQDMRAEIEIYWLNALTYRTVIRSASFNQTRIVNGRVIEEHNTGTFYPRWIQNFVDALLDPAPKAAALRRVPGEVPVGATSRACISNSATLQTNEAAAAQVCFEGAEPRISSGLTFTRYVSFDDFQPFGSQQIPRMLVNDLPVNLLLRGRVTRLEPLRKADQALLKAREFTLPTQQIQTTLVSLQTAESLIESEQPASRGRHGGRYDSARFKPASYEPEPPKPAAPASTANTAAKTIYIRTDRTGRVREAYRSPTDHYNLQDKAVTRALTLKFKPLIVKGVPHQMEAPISMP